MMRGINIWSGERGLGGALTNPTTLTARKGNLSQAWSSTPGQGYPVIFRGRTYRDAEAAYQGHKTQTDADLTLMVEVLVAKLQQHSDLTEEITRRGGVAFLESCSHFLGRPHLPGYSGYARRSGWEWTGAGRSSKMVECLIRAYETAPLQQPQRTDAPIASGARSASTIAAVTTLVEAAPELLRAVLAQNPALRERLCALLDQPDPEEGR